MSKRLRGSREARSLIRRSAAAHKGLLLRGPRMGSSEGAWVDKTLTVGSGLDKRETNHTHGSSVQRFLDGLRFDQTSTGEPMTAGANKADPAQLRSRHSPEIGCRFFSKGDCRSGPECPDAHIIPDGHRISYGKNGMTINGVPFPHARPITRHNQASATTTGPSKAPSKAPVPATPPSSASPSDDDETIENFSACVADFKRSLPNEARLLANNKDQASQCLRRIFLRAVPPVPIVVVVPPHVSEGRAVGTVHARGARRHQDQPSRTASPCRLVPLRYQG
ncbi:hypothetical protein GE09DRAFT_1148656 [Coniochaeta sp. 2T2.1]|nr:hypothetical protein GE09DRAFT_1148656 [Coniochaeta sp. 2T2.1]